MATYSKWWEKQLLAGWYIAEAHYDRFRTIEANTWKEETGPGLALYNLIHMIDQAVCIISGRPCVITADIGTQRPGGKIDDYYDITLHYPT